MSVIIGLLFVLLLVVGYKCRSLIAFLHDHWMFQSALRRVDRSPQKPMLEKKCLRCDSDMEAGHVLVRYAPMNQDLSFLLHSYDPFHLATGTIESMMTRLPVAPNAGYRRGYRCPACGIVDLDSARS
jgi:hypothetical protein